MFRWLFPTLSVFVLLGFAAFPATAIGPGLSNPDVQKLIVPVATTRDLTCEKDLAARKKLFKNRCQEPFPDMKDEDPKKKVSEVCPDGKKKCKKCWKRHQKVKAKEEECGTAEK